MRHIFYTNEQEEIDIFNKIKNNLYVDIYLYYFIIKIEKYEKITFDHNIFNIYHNKLFIL